jgi:hypothetical protein
VDVVCIDSGGQSTALGDATAPQGSMAGTIAERISGSSQVVDQRMVSSATQSDPVLAERVEGDTSANVLPNAAVGGQSPGGSVSVMPQWGGEKP